jgi:hypothetical protein
MVSLYLLKYMQIYLKLCILMSTHLHPHYYHHHIID